MEEKKSTFRAFALRAKYYLCPPFSGYVTVDWNRITNDSSSFSDRMKDKLKIQTKSTGEKFADFAKKNVYLAGGFTGGFFIGLASS